MARLIDAEKLWLTTEYAEDGKVHKYYEQFEVDNAPTIDAEPVRHGKWEESDLDKDYVTCSECKLKGKKGRMAYNPNYAKDLRYCPNCGAKMDEVNDEVN